MTVQPHLLNLSAYINQNLEKDLPLSILAKRVGLSPFHFHRKFGAYFGESLHQHIKRLRLERAAFALLHGSAPVRQIARESGYKTVSAFSHAFSGFAGESPTRYRSTATTGSADGRTEETAMLQPEWIGELQPLDFAFVRGMGNGADIQRSIHDAMEVMMDLVGPLPGDSHGPAATAANGESHRRDGHGHDGQARDGQAGEGATPAPMLECIAATSDIYGISKGGDFRVDVGMEAKSVPAERSGLLGRQTLPGGRYARFDLRCTLDDVSTAARRISLRSLQNGGESPRLSQYFVRFARPAAAAADGLAAYQFFVPLAG